MTTTTSKRFHINGDGIPGVERVPPHDEQAEVCLLSVLASQPESIDAVASLVGSDDFYPNAQSANGMIFQAIRDVAENEVSPDVVSIAERLDAAGELQDIGGVDYLMDILKRVDALPHNAHYYAERIAECSQKRRIIQNAERIVEQAYRSATSLNDLVDAADLSKGVRHFRRIESESLGDLFDENPPLFEPVVHGLFRRQEVFNLIAASKAGKSYLTYSLLLSIASGRDWYGFRTTRGRCLLIDNELHKGTLTRRLSDVAAALKIDKSEVRDHIDIRRLRGNQTNLFAFEREIRGVRFEEFSAIVFDAAYRMRPEGQKENSNDDQTHFYNRADRYAEMTGAAIGLIGHSTKGTQGEKSVVDVGAGGGAQARACDSHIVLRDHEEDGHAVFDAALRSFAPVEPFVLQWCFPVWVPAEDADAEKLKGRLTKGEQRQTEKDRRNMLDIVDVLRKWDEETDGPTTPNKIAEKTPFGRERTKTLLAKLLHEGTVERTPFRYHHNDTHQYCLTDDNEDE